MNNPKKQFSKIYDQLIDKIYRFVFFRVDSIETAQDLTSEAFLKFWEAFKIQKNIENPQAFLYKIARNLTIDFYRKKDKIQLLSTTSRKIIDPRMNLEEKANLNSEFKQVKQALSNLKDEYQEAIILRYLEGIEIPEIAEILEKSEGATRVILHRGLGKLREILENSK